MKIYDASNQIMGRVSTAIARDLLKGESVIVINCEKAVISGEPRNVEKHYLERVWRGDPHHGPFFPRTPQGIFKKSVEGMLSSHKPRGRDALSRLRVYVGVPEDFVIKASIQLKDADVNKLRCKHVSIGDLAVALGNKKRW
jgi:large subunit ribosomal protein L13